MRDFRFSLLNLTLYSLGLLKKASLNKLQTTNPPNVVVEWLTILLCIRKVPVSNLGPETGCIEVFFVVFLSPSRQVLG
jgi:hypothetical protein